MEVVPVNKDTEAIGDFLEGFGTDGESSVVLLGRGVVVVADVVVDLVDGPVGSTCGWAAVLSVV